MTALASVVAVFAVALLEAIFLGNGPRIARADAFDMAASPPGSIAALSCGFV